MVRAGSPGVRTGRASRKPAIRTQRPGDRAGARMIPDGAFRYDGISIRQPGIWGADLADLSDESDGVLFGLRVARRGNPGWV